jgi:hypothetical protein
VDALPPSEGDPGVAGSPEADPVKAVERRLIQANDPREIALWTEVRGEVIRQNEDALDRRAARQQRLEATRADLAKSLLAISVGVYLVQQGYWIVGFLCLGAGLYSLAPDYIRQFGPRGRREQSDDEE